MFMSRRDVTAAPTAGISREDAEDVLRQNLENIIKRAANGQPLTTPQLALMQQAAESDGTGRSEIPALVFAKNQTELAKVLGFKDRKTIQRWLKEPGNPGRSANGKYSVAGWKAYAKSKGHILPEDSDGSNQTLEKKKNLHLQNKLLDFKFKVLRKEYVPTADIEQWGAHLGGEIRKTVVSIHKVASSLAGLTPAEIEIRLKELEDEILSKLHLLSQRTDELKEASDVQD